MTTTTRELPDAKAPHPGWGRYGSHAVDGVPFVVWHHVRSGAVVLSGVAIADYPDGSGEKGPQWHVSISVSGRRATKAECERALRAFDLVGAEEDNHHPGVARHFWRPVDPARRVDCECKENEVVHVDPADGYTWTNPPEAGECRGCELAKLVPRLPCPLHPVKPEGAP